MAVYVITGKLGGGKSLCAVSKIVEYINQGRRIATNLDLYPEKFKKADNRKVDITRLPDKPRIQNLEAIGRGYEGKFRGEKGYGLLVLDECGTWLNSRSWNDKERGAVINWMLHARKLRWDVILIIQHIEMLDKQVVKSLAEHTVWLRRLDKFRIPIIGVLSKVTGKEIRMPKIHLAVVKYGDTQMHPTVDRWVFSGGALYDLYDTEQSFVDSESGNYTLLTPWHLVGRYRKQPTVMDYLNQYLMPIIKKLILQPYCMWRRSNPPRQWGLECRNKHYRRSYF